MPKQDNAMVLVARRLVKLRLWLAIRDKAGDTFLGEPEDEAHHLLTMTRQTESQNVSEAPNRLSSVVYTTLSRPMNEEKHYFTLRPETPPELKYSYGQLGAYMPGTLHITNDATRTD